MTKFDENGKEIKLSEKAEAARDTMFEELNKRVILVSLHRRIASNMQYDVPFTSTVAAEKKIDEDMLQVRKFLVHPEHLSQIRNLFSAAVNLVFNLTAPWDDIGYRMLPMTYWDDLKAKFNSITEELEIKVNELVDNWDDIIADSKKKLGPAFNKNNYPNKNHVKDLFKLELVTTPLKNVNDIRLNLSGECLIDIKREATEEAGNAIDDMFEIANEDCDVSAKLIKILEKANFSNNGDYAMIIEELKAKHNYKEDEDESMMVLDDFTDEEKKDVDEDTPDADDDILEVLDDLDDL